MPGSKMRGTVSAGGVPVFIQTPLMVLFLADSPGQGLTAGITDSSLVFYHPAAGGGDRSLGFREFIVSAGSCPVAAPAMGTGSIRLGIMPSISSMMPAASMGRYSRSSRYHYNKARHEGKYFFHIWTIPFCRLQKTISIVFSITLKETQVNRILCNS